MPDHYSLTFQNSSTLSSYSSKILILGIMNDLLFHGYILKSFYFSFYWNNLNCLLWNNLFVILSNFLNCHIVLLYHLPWHGLYDFVLFVIHYFSSFRDHLFVGSRLVINDFLLIWNILYSALTFDDATLSNTRACNLTYFIGS